MAQHAGYRINKKRPTMCGMATPTSYAERRGGAATTTIGVLVACGWLDGSSGFTTLQAFVPRPAS